MCQSGMFSLSISSADVSHLPVQFPCPVRGCSVACHVLVNNKWPTSVSQSSGRRADGHGASEIIRPSSTTTSRGAPTPRRVRPLTLSYSVICISYYSHDTRRREATLTVVRILITAVLYGMPNTDIGESSDFVSVG